MLPAPSSGIGYHGSAAAASFIWKESHLPLQRSVFENSMVLGFYCGCGTSIFNLERTISKFVRIQDTIRSLSRANQVFYQPQAGAVGFNSALSLQVVSGRKANSHDRVLDSTSDKSDNPKDLQMWRDQEFIKSRSHLRCHRDATDTCSATALE